MLLHKVRPCLMLVLMAVAHQVLARVPFFDPAREADIEDLLGQLTLEEKVHLLHGSAMFYSGGVERFGIPELAHTDGPLGIREEVSRESWASAGRDDDEATYFPTGTALAATWNPALARRYGEAMGREARARDKDVLLAPAINLIRTPLCGRNYEYFSEDPFLVARMAVPYVAGVQSQDVAACVKHYAVNNQETDRMTIDVEVDLRTLHEVYLAAFRATVLEADAAAMMGAYNRVRGHHVCEHPYLLTEVLKEDWGFQGVVISDWGATHSTIAAARAGLDIEMGTIDRPFEDFHFARPLIDAVKNGALEESVVDGMARRVLRVMRAIRLGEPERNAGEIRSPRHSRIVREVAQEAVVLLKNDARILPLEVETLRSVAVIGDNATRRQSRGGFGASVKAAYEITPLEGFEAAFGPEVTVRFAQGYRPQYLGSPEQKLWERPIDNTPDEALVAEAVAAAEAADVAIVVAGTNRDVESEAADRASLRLPFGQEALIRAVVQANPRTIVVIVAGAPVDLSDVQKAAPAIVWAWFNGAESGHALADVLTGVTAPSGKLPFTLPRKLDDLGPHALDAFPGNGETVRYLEGIHVGYRWLEKEQIEPLFPFGFGLTYSVVQLEEARLTRNRATVGDTVELEVSLQNKGKRTAQEVVQVYTSFPGATIDRPARQLVGFRKIEVPASDRIVATVPVKLSELAYYDADLRQLRVPAGHYRLHVGLSSRDLPVTADLEVEERPTRQR